jgi:RES domain-containing protein
VTLPRQWEKHALALIEAASPLTGEFFRSVEIAYAHPDDVVSGEGTRLYGGRFVKAGLRAVYGSADEETALRESSARTRRLAGRSGVAMIEYPRITYVIAVDAPTYVDLSSASADAASILPACLTPSDLAASQEVGQFFRSRSVQAIGYPTAIAGFQGRNLVIFRDVTPPPMVALVNREQILEEFRHLARRIQ